VIASTTEPVFLICSERSGSNLISTIMGTHSGIYSPPPLHFGRTVLLNLYETLQGGTESKAWGVIKNRMAAQVRALQGEDDAQRVQDWLDSQERIDPQRLARYFFQEMMPEAGTRMTFIKENNLHHLMFFLLQCYPEARFVFQVRDPRDFLASAMMVKPGAPGLKFGSIQNAIRIWREDQQGGLYALGLLGRDRVFLQRYEDLVSNPQDVLQELCAFLGLDFEPGMLDFHKTDEATKLAKSAKARKNVATPLMRTNFAKYRTVLKKPEIRKVEKRLGPLMDLFGYPREFDSSDEPYRLLGSRGAALETHERPPLLPRLSYDDND